MRRNYTLFIWLTLLIFILPLARPLAAATLNPRSIAVGDDTVQIVALSPDGTVLATGGGQWNGRLSQQQGILRLWDTRTGALLRDLSGQFNRVQQVLFSPDGHTLVAQSEDGAVNLSEVATGRLLHTLVRPRADSPEHPYITAFSADGSLIMGASSDAEADQAKSRVSLWRAASGQIMDVGLARQQWNSVLTGGRFLPDGKSVALAFYDMESGKFKGGRVEVRDIESGALLRTIVDPGAASFPRALSPTGSYTATLSGVRLDADETSGSYPLKVWDVANGHLRQSFTISTFAFAPLLLSRDGSILIASGTEGTLQVWDVANGKLQQSLGGGFCQSATSLALSLDATTLASVEPGSPRVQVWDLRAPVGSAPPRVRIIGRTSQLQAVTPGSDGRTMQGVSLRREPSEGGQARNLGLEIRRWDVVTGAATHTLIPDERWIERAAFSPDGMLLAATVGVGAADDQSYQPGGGIAIWNLADKRLLRLLPGKAGFSQTMAFSPDGKQLAVGNADGTAALWEVSSGKQLHDLEGAGQISVMAFAPAGDMLAVADGQGQIKTYDVATGAAVLTITAAQAVRGLAFSPDGKSLASVSSNWDNNGGNVSQVQMWSLPTGVLLWGAIEPQRMLTTVAIAPDGKWVVAAGARDSRQRPGGVMEIWDAALGTLTKYVADACQVDGVFFINDGKSIVGYNSDLIRQWDLADAAPAGKD